MKLNFTLHGQRLSRLDKLRPVADSKNYLGAEFTFSHHWGGCEKTAIFKAADGAAYSVLLSEDKCKIPHEVTGTDFYVSVFGVKDEMRITSDEVTVAMEASGYTEGEIPQEPTETVYEQILNRIAESEAAISEEVAGHSKNLANPHSVTKEQIGLSNVDNTSDADKPVSSAMQTALELKVDSEAYNADNSALWEAITDLDSSKADKTDVDAALKLKANQSDLEALQTQSDNNSSSITENQRHITELYNQVDAKAGKGELEDLQTQIGDIETVLADIQADQEALINGGEE